MDNWLLTLQEIYAAHQAFDKGQALFLHAPHRAAQCEAFQGVQHWQCYYAEDAAALLAAGHNVSAEIAPDIKFDVALVRAVQNRIEMKGLIAQAVMSCGPRSHVFVALSNDMGAKALDKDLKAAFKSVDVTIKHKCRGFALDIAAGADIKLLKSWLADAALRVIDKTGYRAQAGLFGWQKIDKGSALLADVMQAADLPLQGKGADFGCGYGYLTAHILDMAGTQIDSWLLLDHDIRALKAAEANLAAADFDIAAIDIDFAWRDAAAPLDKAERYDFIVMNPPFHEGRKGVPDLGLSFIARAAENLKKGGHLYMVANIHLPYEAALRSHFSGVDELAVAQGFKVIKGTK